MNIPLSLAIRFVGDQSMPHWTFASPLFSILVHSSLQYIHAHIHTNLSSHALLALPRFVRIIRPNQLSCIDSLFGKASPRGRLWVVVPFKAVSLKNDCFV